jgi:uncharacterized protein (TIGR02996 family)
MTHDDAFLQAILENPDDDGPRLVFADWLDDHGRPERAEFIRVQCELARMAVFNERRRYLQARQERLLLAHGQKWLRQDWPLASNPTLHGRTFARGFVSELAVCGRDLWDAGVRALVAAPTAAHLTSLDLRKNRVGAAGVKALAGCRHLARLTFLELVLGHQGLRMDQAERWFMRGDRNVAVHGPPWEWPNPST